jgi:hypothetical protein
VIGDFSARGGLTTLVTASYQKPRRSSRGKR